MRQISKRREPASLTRHRRVDGADYNNYREKDQLRDALVAEQRSLCCYCMGRISADWRRMKIEHWMCQSAHDTEQLSYQNLLGGCMGNEGKPREEQHCDTRKGDDDLRWNPANPAHRIETRIFYDPDGTIRSNDDVFDRQLNQVLNLNMAVIRNNRKGSLTAMLMWWRSEKDRRHAPPPKSVLQREIDLRTTGDGALAPFGQVAVWWLRRRLSEMS